MQAPGTPQTRLRACTPHAPLAQDMLWREQCPTAHTDGLRAARGLSRTTNTHHGGAHTARTLTVLCVLRGSWRCLGNHRELGSNWLGTWQEAGAAPHVFMVVDTTTTLAQRMLQTTHRGQPAPYACASEQDLRTPPARGVTRAATPTCLPQQCAKRRNSTTSHTHGQPQYTRRLHDKPTPTPHSTTRRFTHRHQRATHHWLCTAYARVQQQPQPHTTRTRGATTQLNIDGMRNLMVAWLVKQPNRKWQCQRQP